MNFVDNPIYGAADGEMGKGNSAVDGQQSERNEPEEQKEKEGLGESFAKAWPLNAIKTINSLLLLALAITACNGTKWEFSLSWSHFGDAFHRLRIENSGAWSRTLDLYATFVVMFVVSAISLTLFWTMRKNANANGKFLFCIAISDFVVSLISIPLLINALANYGLMAAAEWKYFYPKLTNSSMTLAELTGWSVQHGRWNTISYYDYQNRFTTPSWSYNGFYHRTSTPRPWTGPSTPSMPPTTPTPPTTTKMPIPEEWMLKAMAERKRAILARLGIDSSATILLALLILLNLLFILRLRKLMKNANLCQKDCRELFKDLNGEKNAKYCNSCLVGFFKLAHWFIPTMAILLCQFYTLSLFHWISISVACFFFFANWLKFRNNSSNVPQKIVPIDFVISLSAIAFYIVFIASSGYGRGLIMHFCQLSILLHIFHLVYILILFFNKDGEGTNSVELKLPLISINLSINVMHRNENEAKKIGQKEDEGGPKGENAEAKKEEMPTAKAMMMAI